MKVRILHFLLLSVLYSPVEALAQPDTVSDSLTWTWEWYSRGDSTGTLFDPEKSKGIRLDVKTAEDFPYTMYGYYLSSVARDQMVEAGIPISHIVYSEAPSDADSLMREAYMNKSLIHTPRESEPELRIRLRPCDTGSDTTRIEVHLYYTRCAKDHYPPRVGGYSEAGMKGITTFQAASIDSVYSGLARVIDDVIARFDWINACEPSLEDR